MRQADVEALERAIKAMQDAAALLFPSSDEEQALRRSITDLQRLLRDSRSRAPS